MSKTVKLNVMQLCHLRTVQAETKHTADEEEAQEDEEQDVEEEEEEGDPMRHFQQRAIRHVTSADKSRQCTRRIIAEDASWTLTIVPSLTDICIRRIADNFCC